MSNSTEKLPAITTTQGNGEAALPEAAEQVREIIEVREGRRNPESKQRFVTVSELIAAGVLPDNYT